MFGYKKLNAYIESMNLVKSVYALLKNYPAVEQYALCDQIRRAVLSIPSNIAEGMGRISPKEQLRFIEIAFGSLMEIDCQFEISVELGYITLEQFDNIELQIQNIAKLLSGLRAKRIEILQNKLYANDSITANQ